MSEHRQKHQGVTLGTIRLFPLAGRENIKIRREHQGAIRGTESCSHTCRCRRPHHPSVAQGRPDLAEEWDHRTNLRSPGDVSLGSRYVAGWVCRRDSHHRPWRCSVQNRALKGNGCPACQSQNRLKGRTFGASGFD